MPYFLSKYNPDPLHFYLTATALGTRDTELGEALALAGEANRYTFATLPSAPLGTGSAGMDRKAPCFQIKEDRAAAATSMHGVLRVVDNLKTIRVPILPHTPVLTHRTQNLHKYLGHGGQLSGTQHAVEYQEEARLGGLRSHAALTYDHTGAIGIWAPSALRRSSRSWMRAWSKRSTRGWKGKDRIASRDSEI